MQILKLERVYSARFQSLGQALAYWNNSRPARQKFPNLLEPEAHGTARVPDFSGESPTDIWNSVQAAIQWVLAHRSGRDQRIWRLRNVGDREAEQLAVETIAAQMSITDRRVRQVLRRINDDLIRELRRRWLLRWEVNNSWNGPMQGKSRLVLATISSEAMGEGMDFQVEPTEDGKAYQLVVYTGSDRKPPPVAVAPGEGALVASKAEISRKFA